MYSLVKKSSGAFARGAAGLMFLLLAQLCYGQNMRAHFIDVGQGASTLLEFPCAAVLVDTGGENNKEFRSTDELTAYLDAFFERRKDLKRTFHSLILTHPHLDHTLGVKSVLANYRVLNAVTNGQELGSGKSGQKALHDKVAQGEETTDDATDDIGYVAAWRHEIPQGQGLTGPVIDPVKCRTVDPKITVLWGSSREKGDWTAKEFGNQNNHSVVVRVDYGTASMLITGDLEDSAIPALVNHYRGSKMLDVDVYRVGHHGSHNGTSEGLLRAITPDYAVMATGPSDRKALWTAWAYGHPRKQVFDLLVKHVKKTRPTITVPVAPAAKKFTNLQLSKAIYATGWDGTVVLEATTAGVWSAVDPAEMDQDEAALLVNLNTASLDELMTLPMIGQARANAILRSRQEAGNFGSVDDLLRIPRFGKGTVNVLRNLVTTQN